MHKKSIAVYQLNLLIFQWKLQKTLITLISLSQGSILLENSPDFSNNSPWKKLSSRLKHFVQEKPITSLEINLRQLKTIGKIIDCKNKLDTISS